MFYLGTQDKAYDEAWAQINEWPTMLRKIKSTHHHEYIKEEEKKIESLIPKLEIYQRSELYKDGVKILGRWSSNKSISTTKFKMVRDMIILSLLVDNGCRTGVLRNMIMTEAWSIKVNNDKTSAIIEVCLPFFTK